MTAMSRPVLARGVLTVAREPQPAPAALSAPVGATLHDLHLLRIPSPALPRSKAISPSACHASRTPPTRSPDKPANNYERLPVARRQLLDTYEIKKLAECKALNFWK
jgi:hypothetical protein